MGEGTDWHIQHTIDIATESGNGGDVDVKRMKLDLDAAAASADDVTGSDAADAASYSCVLQHAHQLHFRVAANPELDDSTSTPQSKCCPICFSSVFHNDKEDSYIDRGPRCGPL